MSLTAIISSSTIDHIEIFQNSGKKSLSVLKASLGADYAINGTLYDMAKWLPVMHFRCNGVTVSSDSYKYNGYAWNEKDTTLKVVSSTNKNNYRNYICGVELLSNFNLTKMYYGSDLGGKRGRTAIGLTSSGDIALYCAKDGSADACTPEELQQRMFKMGLKSAIMLDGGASSQCSFADGNAITSGRVVQNVILIYLKKGAADTSTTATTTKKYTVFLDPGHGGSDNSNGSPDGKYKEHAFSLDLGLRIRDLLVKRGFIAKMTRMTDATVSLSKRSELANAANADLFLSIHTNASAGTGWSNASGLVAYTYAVGGKRDEFAKLVLSSMEAAGVKTFGEKLYHAKFAVLSGTNMPACLVEYGFHTNKNDVALLLTDSYKDKLAEATVDAICKYFGVSVEQAPAVSADVSTYTVTANELTREKATEAFNALKAIGITATTSKNSK